MSTSIYKAFGFRFNTKALSNTICPFLARASFQKKKSLLSFTTKFTICYVPTCKENKLTFRMKAMEKRVTIFTSFLTHARHCRAKLAPLIVSLILKLIK